jgi:hypothetical protein
MDNQNSNALADSTSQSRRDRAMELAIKTLSHTDADDVAVIRRAAAIEVWINDGRHPEAGVVTGSG